MSQLVNIDQMSPEQLDFLQTQIFVKKQDFLQRQVEALIDENTKFKTVLDIKSQELEEVKHRMDNYDLTNIEGTPQQRFNKMIRLYVVKNGIQFDRGYKDFTQAYNTAFRANLTALHENFQARNGKCTMPEFLNETGKIEDAIRVADKMLNKRPALRSVN